MLVQPLVENAIKHGKTERPLHLLVRARVRRGRLRVTVRDDGRGIARDVIERVLEPGVRRGDRSRPGKRQPPSDRALRRGRAFAFVSVRHRRAPRGPRGVIRALIVDDEAPARGELRYPAAARTTTSSVVGEAASAADALRARGDPEVDVVFLDVEMAGRDRARCGAARPRANRSARGRLRHRARASTPSTRSRSRRSTTC